jgi:hypothetical protein
MQSACVVRRLVPPFADGHRRSVRPSHIGQTRVRELFVRAATRTDFGLGLGWLGFSVLQWRESSVRHRVEERRHRLERAVVVGTRPA